MRSFIAFIAFLGFVLTGYCLAIQSWGGGVFVYLGEERAPAAVRNLGDYSQVNRRTLYQSAHKQLLDGAEIEQKDGYVGVHLGNPLVRNDRGSSDFACRVRGREGLYDRIEMKFTGTGISENGESGEMIVVSPCESNGEASLLSTIWIPMKDIVAQPAADRRVNFESMSVSLEKMPSSWPDNWVLTEVRVFSADGDAADPVLLVSGERMREARESLLQFDWK